MNKEGTEFKSLLEYYGFTNADEKKYPVIIGILRELTPERVDQEIKEVQALELPPRLQKWVDEYKKMGGGRSDFLWKWIFKGTTLFTGDRPRREYLEDLITARMLVFMLDTHLDDIADVHRNSKLLQEALKVPFAQNRVDYTLLDEVERRSIDLALGIWNEIRRTIGGFPRFAEFRDILDYDILQLLNAVEYCYLVHKNSHIYNSREAWDYLPHFMQVTTNITLELMCSPEFKILELGRLRRAAWHAQRMSRIGNWISTWERELPEQDFTSAVVILALEDQVVGLDDLLSEEARLNAVAQIRASGIEKGLLVLWEENHREVDTLSRQIESFGTRQMLSALEQVIVMHLTSRGYK